MGEIRIKSGNLFVGELEQGSLGTSAGQEYPTTTRVRTKKPGVNLQAGTYTIDCVGATGGVVVYVYNKDSSWDKESSSKNWQAMPLTFSLSSEKLVRFAFRKTGDSDILPSEVTDIQLLEGSYTPETIPQYQPYFLNRPAHQYVNGEWKDIPTHHFINNRWQGELTSQSPLEFRATGQNLLDWRIEGASGGIGDWDETEQKYRIPVRVESENLFNSETSTSVYLDVRGVEHPSEKSLTSDYISVNANTGYTLGLTGNTSSTNLTAYCFYNSNKEFISSDTYNPSARGNIIRLLTPNDCAYFRFTYNRLRELVEFVEGQYGTLPPYSTTTTLYTDHQLMDGDSIDYATDQTTIPLATGNNTLTVDTAVKPSKVFVKFEG